MLDTVRYIEQALENRQYWRALTRMDNLERDDPGKVRTVIDLEHHREGLVREMLELIKSGEMMIPYGAAKCMQDNMDLTWPELDIIRRSTYNDMTKNADPQPNIFEQEEGTGYPYPASEILERLDMGHPLGLYYGIQALRYDGVKDNIILGAMKPYDKRLADWLDPVLAAAKNHAAKNHAVKDWVAQAVNLMMMGADWPHLKAVIEKHRDLIIKHLLQEYKSILDSNDWVSVRLSKLGGRLHLISQAGYDWPELMTIERSLNAADKGRPTLDEDDDENLYGKEWRAKLEFNEHLANFLYELRGNNRIEMITFLQEMGYLDVETVLSGREMSAVLSNKDKIIRSLLECMKSGEITHRGMTKAIQALNNIGINWPELEVMWKSLESELSRKPMAESRGNQLIRDMDWMLKQNIPNGHYRAISTVIKNMDYGGFGDREIGDLLSKYRKPIIEMLEGFLRGDESTIRSALDNISVMAMHGVDWPELYDIVERAKDSVMYWVLHEIAYGHVHEGGLPHLYADLLKIGIQWPEFDIIKRSLDSQAKGR